MSGNSPLIPPKRNTHMSIYLYIIFIYIAAPWGVSSPSGGTLSIGGGYNKYPEWADLGHNRWCELCAENDSV